MIGGWFNEQWSPRVAENMEILLFVSITVSCLREGITTIFYGHDSKKGGGVNPSLSIKIKEVDIFCLNV